MDNEHTGDLPTPPPPVVITSTPSSLSTSDRSEASEERATPSAAEMPAGVYGVSAADSDWVTAAAGSPADAERLWLASDLARELDADLDEAFEHLQRGFEKLLAIGEAGELGALGPDRLITMAQRLEAHRTRLIMIDSHVVEAATEDQLHTHVCVSSIPLALAQTLHISKGEANARVKRAEQLLPQNGFSSGITPPRLPLLADAVRDGQGVSTDQVDVINKAMKRVHDNGDLDNEKRELAEQLLVRHAAGLTHAELQTTAAAVEQAVNPDGAVPSEHVAQARRGVTIGPLGRDGTHKLTGFLTRELKALFDAAIGPLAAPRPADDQAGADDRTAAQRTHDALHDACQRLLDLAGVPATGGTAATVHITIDLDQLIESLARLQDDHAGRSAQRAAGHVAGGDGLTITELMRLARDAVLIPVWISNTRGIVAYGRERRTASPSQTHALIARDGGCSFPGCEAPPDWCQRHHVVPWWAGGQTDLDNLTLVCGYHHREFDKRGWAVDIVNGIPVWTPPAWIDREQQPQINARIKIPCQDEIQDLADAIRRAERDRAERERDRGGGSPPTDHDLTGLIDPAEDIDELVQLIAASVPDEQRDAFYRDAADLIGSYLDAAAGREQPAPAFTG
ncbi:HNH endonuclease signature motif containing protein [Blastococcus sp. Marseille-P5729]|uniref:HNH endonuclease signature motif containing protein n=1 Tax=Blastococcus sp. Marseille-P5729 TaxID=2086582 RepID=UPI00131B4810|nr:HNH endonuclease signature motif containing protein [Blastococcus sp. Marseille-P5729]